MCLYITCLPLHVTSRILDCFFYEGREIFFKVGLAWLKLKSEDILKEQVQLLAPMSLFSFLVAFVPLLTLSHFFLLFRTVTESLSS